MSISVNTKINMLVRWWGGGGWEGRRNGDDRGKVTDREYVNDVHGRLQKYTSIVLISINTARYLEQRLGIITKIPFQKFLTFNLQNRYIITIKKISQLLSLYSFFFFSNNNKHTSQ